ncbi:threonine synthase [Clostridium massiliodielmoense]|uniref:threonine synthase n=1 Tax=Clostridium massiliodielmoense TaxID=1776385 RepID=UPI0004DA572E|nr:threonine synthase [Clostridium massiliodielmoense]KEH99339.1 threonine synthase [Clostridium botulinum C/D str. BKT12695]
MEKIFYRSTRGGEDKTLASQAILKGIADDGGLFVPNKIPKIDKSLEELSKMNYRELAYFVMSKFFTDFTEEELKTCIDRAYDSKFDTENIAEVKKVGEDFFLELYHGPTLAFKDMALSILPHLLTTSAKKQSLNKEIVILTATSGDTGKAALEGFTNVDGIKIIVFFPEEGVSEIQKKQMVTHKGNNTYVVGIEGNFDDAQSGVKKIFRDESFINLLDKNNYVFSSANSINIGRLIPQVVYYFYGYLKMCNMKEVAIGEKINVIVPTGNFGNILAAYYAKNMGLPINKLICASNDNKVLYEFLSTGKYDKLREFVTTISPSMDILISSNLERLLYSISGEETDVVKELMNSLDNNGHYEISDNMKEKLKDFYGNFASEDETRKGIKEVYQSSKYLIDTHTSVAYSVNKKYKEEFNDNTKSLIVSTASPYKFTYAVMNALDNKFKDYDDFKLIKEMNKFVGCEEPKAIKDIEAREVLHKTVCKKDNMKKEIKRILNI